MNASVNGIGESELLGSVLRGASDAIAFCELLGRISQTWDDLVDRDTEVTTKQISAAFYAALIELPLNPFYQAHVSSLHPLMQSAIFDWLVANELERGTPHDQALAFVLRDSLTAVVVHCAALVGGHKWAIDNAARIRRYFHDEPAAEYVRKLKEKAS